MALGLADRPTPRQQQLDQLLEVVADGGFTPAGREAREQIERDTDAQTAPVLAALGDDLEELVQLLLPWGRAIREAKGYPASGPHDLARVAAAR